MARSGADGLGGRCQVNPSGGLLSMGHPLGASGLRMIYSVYEQILERIPTERKVKNDRFGLTYNIGGMPHSSVCGISIIGRLDA